MARAQPLGTDRRIPRPEQRSVRLADALRERTRTLHAEAERAGVVRAILCGRVSRYGYALLLRNLFPVYQELERGLERHRRAPGVRAIARPGLCRAQAIESDLVSLYGASWSRRLPHLPAGEGYAGRVLAAVEGEGVRLIAHAYARYLGDLSGGQILRRLLARSLGLGPESLAFYDFPQIADVEAFKAGYRAALDRAAGEITDIDGVVEEAALAFQLNIAVSNAVQDAACGLDDAVRGVAVAL
jgi:heme oxygenase (biliverdin-producing, ferredoxin)